MFHVPNEYRVTEGYYASKPEHGCNGMFRFKLDDAPFQVVASDGRGWEHVSVTTTNKRTPTWEEMVAIKEIFWDENDCVLQIHPPKKDYVNAHPYCLHLWRKSGKNLATPPRELIG